MTTIEDTTRAILDLEDQRLAAMVAADVDTLDRILDDDLSYVHTSAALDITTGLASGRLNYESITASDRVDTKESLTTGLASGRLNYESITASDRVVRVYDSCAIVRGSADVHVNDNSFSLEFTVVYVRPGGHWQMTSWHATRK